MQGDRLRGNCNAPGKIGNPEWVLALRIVYDKLYELASKLYVGMDSPPAPTPSKFGFSLFIQVF